MIWFQAKCRQHQLIKKTGRNRGKTYIYEAPPHVQYMTFAPDPFKISFSLRTVFTNFFISVAVVIRHK
jgi:hypothetical protein